MAVKAGWPDMMVEHQNPSQPNLGARPPGPLCIHILIDSCVFYVMMAVMLVILSCIYCTRQAQKSNFHTSVLRSDGLRVQAQMQWKGEHKEDESWLGKQIEMALSSSFADTNVLCCLPF